jgi:hypothetical protein
MVFKIVCPSICHHSRPDPFILTTRIRGGDYEVMLPRVRWLPGADEGAANVLGLTSIENHRLERRAGQFEKCVLQSVRHKMAWLLELN